MTGKKKKKVLVAMSGGVDSSVAAALLKDQGYEVVGCFMRLGSEDSVEEVDTCQISAETVAPTHRQGCCSLNDTSDARMVAALLDIPFYVCNFKRDFGRVIDYFVDEYNAGRTPNPCVRCNQWLKFGKLAAYARSIDAGFVATGHYARIELGVGSSRLLTGIDRHKDQSYVLFGTPREQLRHMLLPIGGYKKAQVRQLARDRKLPVFDKPDSQEICFVPNNNYASLITRLSPDRVRKGQMIDQDGHVLGEHEGHQHFTIGQRRGLSVSLGHPIYVIDKDDQTNTITVGPDSETFSAGLLADQTNWLDEPPTQPRRCQIKIRSNGAAAMGLVRITASHSLEVQFDEPQRAVSPGQAVVCYNDEQVIGGGWITEAFRC